MIVMISPTLRDKSVEIPISIITPGEDSQVVLPLAPVLIDRPGVGF
jgi:hypothetical protein